jgi:hypothetical protein
MSNQDRLKQIEALMEKSLITKSEPVTKRKAIIDKM